MDVASEISYVTPFINSTLLPMLLLSLAKQKHSPNTAKTIKTEYDYVIVGGGTAGSVVASRLSEMPCVSVLLLEAGKPPPLLTDVPGFSRFFYFSDIDWQYKTVPQRHTGAGLVNRQIVWPSGKALGGTSILSRNIGDQGNNKDYDTWAAEGAKGWSYKDMQPFFNKMEAFLDQECKASRLLPVEEPVNMNTSQYKPKFKDALVKTCNSLGYKLLDHNFYKQTGTLRRGQRCSAAKAYLVPAENRTNLDILPNAMVRKVLIENKRAFGVQFDFHGTTYEVKAKKEVIMSAGTTNTAQLLMLSGIGPRKELEKFKIPVIADLPVGKNFQDHVGSFITFELNPDIPGVMGKIVDNMNIYQYIQNRSGPLGATDFVSTLEFLKNNSTFPKKDVPDHKLYFGEVQSEIIRDQVGLKPEVYSQVYSPFEGRSLYRCASSVLHPWSRGTVTLQSDNPYDPPLIDPNYFGCLKDIQAVVEGLKSCVRFGTDPQMRSVGSSFLKTLFPGCEKHADDEDLYFECQVRSMVIAFNHQVGTARMGDPNDTRTVVDPQLRVLTINGLRIVDASVMPVIPSGGTYLPTIMVAEKASDIIKATADCHAGLNKNVQFENEPGSDEVPAVTLADDYEDDYEVYFEDETAENDDETSVEKPDHTPTYANTIFNNSNMKFESDSRKDKREMGDSLGNKKEVRTWENDNDNVDNNTEKQYMKSITEKYQWQHFSARNSSKAGDGKAKYQENNVSKNNLKNELQNSSNENLSQKNQTLSYTKTVTSVDQPLNNSVENTSNHTSQNTSKQFKLCNKEVTHTEPENREIKQSILHNRTFSSFPNETDISQNSNSNIHNNRYTQLEELSNSENNSSTSNVHVINNPSLTKLTQSDDEMTQNRTLAHANKSSSIESSYFHDALPQNKPQSQSLLSAIQSQHKTFKNLDPSSKFRSSSNHTQSPNSTTYEQTKIHKNSVQPQPVINNKNQTFKIPHNSTQGHISSNFDRSLVHTNSSMLQGPMIPTHSETPLSSQTPLTSKQTQAKIFSQITNVPANIQIHIQKSTQSELSDPVHQMKSNIIRYLQQMLNPKRKNILPTSMPSSSLENPIHPPNTPLNIADIRPSIDLAVIEQLAKLKQMEPCDKEFCESILKFMHCQKTSCQKRKEFSSYLYSVLCSS